MSFCACRDFLFNHSTIQGSHLLNLLESVFAWWDRQLPIIPRIKTPLTIFTWFSWLDEAIACKQPQGATGESWVPSGDHRWENCHKKYGICPPPLVVPYYPTLLFHIPQQHSILWKARVENEQLISGCPDLIVAQTWCSNNNSYNFIGSWCATKHIVSFQHHLNS